MAMYLSVMSQCIQSDDGMKYLSQWLTHILWEAREGSYKKLYYYNNYVIGMLSSLKVIIALT